MATKNWPQSYSQSSGTCNEKVVLSADKALKIFLMSVDTQSPKKDQCDGIDTDSLLIKSNTLFKCFDHKEMMKK